MPAAAYYSWDRLGRPLEPAQPVRELVEALRVGYPDAAHLFGWYADESHYATNFPEDHTPFSFTGWPDPDPPWIVFATDVMHRPDLGVDCNALFDYWIGEARAGRFPSLKYLIWQAQLYDVRNDWEPTDNADHFDHIHGSFRTDFVTTGLGAWNPIPGAAVPDPAPEEEDDDMGTKGIIIQQNGPGGGIVRLYDHPLLGIPVWANVGAAETVAGWTAAGWAGPIEVTSIEACGSPAGTVAQQLLAAIAAGGIGGIAGITREQVEDIVRDAVADLGEGGAAQVRADA